MTRRLWIAAIASAGFAIGASAPAQAAAASVTAANPGVAVNQVIAPDRTEQDDVSEQDREWLRTASAGDLFEIISGRFAMHRTEDQDVRAFGAMLVRDHSKAYREKAELSHDLGVQVTTTLTERQTADLRRLYHADDADFDELFLEIQASAHERAVEAAEEQIEDGDNTRVVDQAERELPVLERHLEQVEDLQADVAGADDEVESV